MIIYLNQLYPNRVIATDNIEQIPNTGYMVYILIFNGKPIIVGHGKKNRSKVIFDDLNKITTSHLKAFFVRLYNVFGEGNFERYIIICENKTEANEIEKVLHKEIGGNNRSLPTEIREKLFDGIERNSITYLLLEIALRSSFDGISDLKKWKKDGIIPNNVWIEISNKLLFNFNKKNE